MKRNRKIINRTFCILCLLIVVLGIFGLVKFILGLIPVFSISASETPEIPAFLAKQTNSEIPEQYELEVPYISQEDFLPTGCEIVSTAMVLQYWGEDLSSELLANMIPQQELYYEDGILYGPDPNRYFVGSPYDPNSYGCYAPVIQNLVSSLSSNLKAEVVKGKSLRSLCEEYVINDQPVLIWCTINLVESAEGTSWRLPNGEDFTWKRNEHCMVLSGWDEENFICMDPYESNGRVVLPADTLQDRYEEMGTQAVVISPQS